jgi:hypothetical protein
MAKNGLTKRLRRARASGVPIISINTADQTATAETIRAALELPDNPDPIFRWDLIDGVQALNNAGADGLGKLGVPGSDLGRPPDLFGVLRKFPAGSILIMMSAHNVIEDISVRQGVLNARDLFESEGSMLVLLGPEIKLPADLTSAVEPFDEPLPTRAEIHDIVDKTWQAAVGRVTDVAPNSEVLEKAAGALVGLSAFSAKQISAMSISKPGLDISECWERKRTMIEQTAGLRVLREKLTFGDIGGYVQAIEHGNLLFGGEEPPEIIVFVDEIEKAIAGAGSDAGGPADSSGTSQDQMGVVLTQMEANKHEGMLILGPPGGGKSRYAQALGGNFDVLTIQLDLGAAKGGIVGQSEMMIRNLFKMLVAVGGSRCYWVATCNKLANIPVALRRRFTDGIWFFDLPQLNEQLAIWAYHGKAYGVDVSEKALSGFDWSLFSGAEIRNTCRKARRYRCSIEKAAKFIVPVAVSDPSGLESLRAQATGNYLSASYEGVYRRPGAAPAGPGRRFTVVNKEGE